MYSAKLVDLPCVLEAQKTLDNKRMFKVADICQVRRALVNVGPPASSPLRCLLLNNALLAKKQSTIIKVSTSTISFGHMASPHRSTTLGNGASEGE